MIAKRDTLMIIIVSYSSFLNEAFLRFQKKSWSLIKVSGKSHFLPFLFKTILRPFPWLIGLNCFKRKLVLKHNITVIKLFTIEKKLNDSKCLIIKLNLLSLQPSCLHLHVLDSDTSSAKLYNNLKMQCCITRADLLSSAR